MQQQHGALSYEDLRKSVEISYKQLTDEIVTKVCNAVRANFKVAIKQKGGNWYVEHRHKDRVAEQQCCRCLATYTGDGASALNLCDHRGCMLGVHERCLGRNESSAGRFYCDTHRK